MRGNVLAQPFGAGTIADLALPERLVRRVADRAIIDSYDRRFRLIEDRSERVHINHDPGMSGECPQVRLIRGVTSGHTSDGPEERRDVPRNLGGSRRGAFEAELPGRDAPYELRRATEVVTRRLARDGILTTAMESLRALGAGARADPAGALWRAGVPVDLLDLFESPGSDGFAAGGAAEWIAARLASGAAPGALRERLGRARLRPRSSLPGFAPTDDAGGDGSPLMVRLQATRADDWLGIDDGGSLDIARQVAALLPDVPLVISAHESHAARLSDWCAAWSRDRNRTAPITVIAEGLRLSQWAQDNARPGTLERGGIRVPAALLPRYASRGEECASFVPGDTFAAESLVHAGVEVARSPLHFQGGNTLFVRDGNRRVLLLGEAEIARNVALGLTREQACELFAAEFSAAQVVILPAASYHLDYELFVRSDRQGAPCAFVADELAAAQTIIGCGIAAMVKAGVLAAGAADPDRPTAVLEALIRGFDPERGFQHQIASIFTTGAPVDPGAAAMGVLLEALDTVLSHNGLDAAVLRRLDGHTLAMLSARRRAADDRAALRREVAALGWKVAAVPALPAPTRGLAALNALSVGARTLVPTGPAFFAAASNQALAGLASSGFKALGVNTAESQRRHGALRCAVAVFA